MVLIYYNDGIYISKNIYTDFRSFTTFQGPVDFHFGLEISRKLTESQGFSYKWSAQVKLCRFESVLLYYNDEIYISNNISTDFHSFTPFLGPVDLHFGLEISQKWLKIKDYRTNGRLKVNYADLNWF